jgi:hypothetical protein
MHPDSPSVKAQIKRVEGRILKGLSWFARPYRDG